MFHSAGTDTAVNHVGHCLASVCSFLSALTFLLKDKPGVIIIPFNEKTKTNNEFPLLCQTVPSPLTITDNENLFTNI